MFAAVAHAVLRGSTSYKRIGVRDMVRAATATSGRASAFRFTIVGPSNGTDFRFRGGRL